MRKDKGNRIFRMKQFYICDEKSANKIGIDGVLIASWADIPERCNRILDVGCGCGIMTLMMAQRAENATVIGIDIEPNAIEEAKSNCFKSPFSSQICILNKDFESICKEVETGLMSPFDLIISNPPFFDTGVDPNLSSRMTARHCGTLSPEILIKNARRCLNMGGRLAFIGPYMNLNHYLEMIATDKFTIHGICSVAGSADVLPKRVMLELQYDPDLTPPASTSNYHGNNHSAAQIPVRQLIIRDNAGNYTEEYIKLGKDFYLKF